YQAFFQGHLVPVGDGVYIRGGLPGDPTGATLVGNRIGTDRAGNVPLPNNRGVVIDLSSNNFIGTSASPIPANIISGNRSSGIVIVNGSIDNHVDGNYVGVKADGTTPLGNDSNGVAVDASSRNFIGTTVLNVISGNHENG